MKAINPILLIGVLVLGFFLYLEKCKKSNHSDREALQLISSLNDSLRHYKAKDSMNVATISVITTQSDEAFTSLFIANDEIKALQATVKDYKGKLKAGSSVTKALIETAINNTNKTNVSTEGDTVRIDSFVYIYPTYSDSILNKWLTYRSSMNKDSAKVNIKINNEFSAIVGVYKKKPFVDLITENPYSSVKTLRTYQVSMPKQKRFGVGPNLSYGLSDDFKQRIFIGVGIQYNILRL